MAYILVMLFLHCLGSKDCIVCGYKQIFFTPAEDNYYLTEDYGHSIIGKTYFLFEVQACSNVRILLMQNRSDITDNVYEVVIGDYNNTQSTIRRGSQGTNITTVDHTPLDCNTLLPFWISWANNTVRAGSGLMTGIQEFISFIDSEPMFIEFLSISTSRWSSGHWIFDNNDFMNECCAYEPRDCSDIHQFGSAESGVYYITPAGTYSSFKAFCDMTETDGWLVFQRRVDGSENFYRSWCDYKTGFGDPSGEFWLGNDHLHYLTSQGAYQLRIDLEDFEGRRRYAIYENFKIGDESELYRLTIGTYSGDAEDSLSFHNGAVFSTFDKDNDSFKEDSCAQKFSGAWWYSHCHTSNLNGLYLHGDFSTYANGVVWEGWRGYYYSLKTTEMKIKRK